LRRPACPHQWAARLSQAVDRVEAEPVKAQPLRSTPTEAEGEPQAVSASRHELFVIPRGWGDGFRASIRGHLLDLADPTSHGLAPNSDDLLVASIASDCAWFVRRFLRERALDDYVSVSAGWSASEDAPSLGDVDVTITVSKTAAPMRAILAAALETRLAARSRHAPLHFRVRAE
jgi:hypothetical protein